MPESKPKYRAVILTALAAEYKAARDQLALATVHERVHNRGTIYEVGLFMGAKADWEVCLVEVGAGNAAASFEAERAISAFKPAVVLFVGIAGGLKDVSIGDIVFATKIYGYESGKDAAQFQFRPSVGESTYALEQRARAEARKLDWVARLKQLSPNLAPKVFVGPLAAGEKVVASTRSRTFEFLKKHYGDSLAVEMEGRGFLNVIHANRQVEAGVVRGISDLIDDKTAVELRGTQEMAAAHAAAFAFQILDQFDIAADIPEGVEESSQVRYVVLISGQFKEQDVSFAKAAFELLKVRAKDPSMILEKVTAGSIAIHIAGMLSGFQRLVIDFRSGDLTNVVGKKILNIKFGSIVASSEGREEIRTRNVTYKVAELERENLKNIYPRLKVAATMLLKREGQRWVDMSAEDLVSEALVRYLNGSRVRPADLDLLTFLIGIMRSIKSSYVQRHVLDARHFGQRVDDFTEADFVIDTLAQPETEVSAVETMSLVRLKAIRLNSQSLISRLKEKLQVRKLPSHWGCRSPRLNPRGDP